MKSKSISLSLIRTDAGTQSRAEINVETVEEYAGLLKSGHKFPPVVVFYDGTSYFLADGFHRVNGAMMNDAVNIHADIRKGSRLDAFLFSLGANRDHGLKRTNADKRHCVKLALAEFPKASDRALAKMCGVGPDMVAPLRQLSLNDSSKRTGLDGKERGKPKVADILKTSPGDARISGQKTPVPFLTASPVTSPGRIEPATDRLSSALSDKLQPETATWADVKRRVTSGAMSGEKAIALALAALALDAGGEIKLSNQSLRAVLLSSPEGHKILRTTIHATGIEHGAATFKWERAV